MSIISSVAKIGEVVAVWLNPERKEKVVLRKAISAAKEIISILRKEGRYSMMSDVSRHIWEVHYEKQLRAWEDGTS